VCRQLCGILYEYRESLIGVQIQSEYECINTFLRSLSNEVQCSAVGQCAGVRTWPNGNGRNIFAHFLWHHATQLVLLQCASTLLNSVPCACDEIKFWRFISHPPPPTRPHLCADPLIWNNRNSIPNYVFSCETRQYSSVALSHFNITVSSTI
jgi:hypothetical protein